MKQKVAIIGHHAFLHPQNDGQTVKTQQLTKALKGWLGVKSIKELDTQGIFRRWPLFLWRLYKICHNSENLIMLPAHNGLLIFPFLCLLFRSRRTKLFYSVIGGWLPSYIERHSIVEKLIRRFDGIWVETNVMKKALEKRGFSNVCIVPNFKDLSILTPNDIDYPSSPPFKLCMFSRIMEKKGIEDAINCVSKINNTENGIVYTLDIYGPIAPNYVCRFDELTKNMPDFIHYKGCVPAEDSTRILRQYFALLFPTKFPTEGIPGTIIDGYAAGTPVISAKWNSFADVVDDGKTGIGFEQLNINELMDLLNVVALNPDIINSLRANCLKKAEEFTPSYAKELILRLIG